MCPVQTVTYVSGRAQPSLFRKGSRSAKPPDCAGCVRILEPVTAEVVRICGSGAQREMIEDMLLPALMRSGEAVQARALLDAEVVRQPRFITAVICGVASYTLMKL